MNPHGLRHVTTGGSARVDTPRPRKKAAILEAFDADTYQDGLRLGRAVIEQFRGRYPFEEH